MNMLFENSRSGENDNVISREQRAVSIVLKEKTELSDRIRKSFHPRNTSGYVDFVSLPDQKDGLFICRSFKNEQGEVKSAVWLNPDVWQNALDEFTHFAQGFDLSSELRFLITSHKADKSEYTSVSIEPVLIERDGKFRSTGQQFALSPDGHLSFDTTDLGDLDPARTVGDIAAQVIADVAKQREIDKRKKDPLSLKDSTPGRENN